MPYKDPEKKRAWERARPRRSRPTTGRAPSPRAPKPHHFVSVDGEDLDGRFSMLAASCGERIDTPGRDIRLGEACVMLMRIVERERGRGVRPILVGYSINYDIQRLVRTLPLTLIAALLDRKMVPIQAGDRRFAVRYTPHKCLEVIERGGTAFRLYDVGTFFQQAFVTTCAQWLPDYTDDIAFMSLWKARRGGFEERDREEIARYNDTENRCLDEVMARLYAAFERSGLGLPLHPWGPGAVADAALRGHDMAPHYTVGSDYPPDVAAMIECAFFGGRSQVLQAGCFDQAYDYDLHSAYPAAIAGMLPSATGRWKKVATSAAPRDEAIYRVRWATPLDNPLTPFPHRGRGGTITYPHAGEGCYWGVEVRAAMSAFPRGSINIVEAWHFTANAPSCWAWYAALASARVAMKREGKRDLERVAKLVLNSVYGKAAQTKPAPGRWTSLLWAGMITAYCRARVLDLASQNPPAVISIATDGVLTTKPLTVPSDTSLGEWGYGGEGSLFVVQPGVYQLADKQRTRGFRGADWTEMRRQWLMEGRVEYEHPHSRFVTLQEGLDRGTPEIMAEWEETTTIYRSIIAVSAGTYNARVPAAPIPDHSSLSRSRQVDPDAPIPRGYEYRWKAALVILGRAEARAILRQAGLDAVLASAKRAERVGRQ